MPGSPEVSHKESLEPFGNVGDAATIGGILLVFFSAVAAVECVVEKVGKINFDTIGLDAPYKAGHKTRFPTEDGWALHGGMTLSTKPVDSSDVTSLEGADYEVTDINCRNPEHGTSSSAPRVLDCSMRRYFIDVSQIGYDRYSKVETLQEGEFTRDDTSPGVQDMWALMAPQEP